MCKRFYVEVKGLGEDGKERLVNAGINGDSIIVIDEEHRNKPIFDAIYTACGVTKDEILSTSRRHNQVIAREIYVHYAIIAGDTIQTLYEELKRDRTLIRWYLERYQNMMKYDKSFVSVSNRVEQLLEQDPNWCPPKLEKSTTSKKKCKKRHSKKKKQNKPKLTPE